MRCFIVSLLLLFCIGCTSNSGALFIKKTSDHTGIGFINKLTYTEEFNPYTYRNFYNGAGVAVGDINNDGLLDLFFTGNIVGNKLYLNQGNFKFKDITVSAGVGCEEVWSSGSTFVDLNHDGFLDLYVCKSGKPGGAHRNNELFINNGDLTFTESSKAYGLDIIGLSVQAAFFDADRDGDLDCYLLNNSIRSVGGYDLIKDQRTIPDANNNGNKFLINDNGVFKDNSAEANIYSSAIGFGLGITLSDFNNDTWPDLFISNDFFERDYYYLNNQKGGFTEQVEEHFTALSKGSMGADAADLDNDLRSDLIVTEMLPASLKRKKTKAIYDSWDKYQLQINNGYYHQFPRNALQRNTEAGFFEISRMSELAATEWSWASLIFDMDNDGLKDVFISNGIYKDLLDRDYLNHMANEESVRTMIKNGDQVIKNLIDIMPSQAVANKAFKNEGDFRFTDMESAWGFDEPTFSNGSAYADLDNDGDLDLIINNVNMPAFVYENTLDTLAHRSLQVQFKSTSQNTSLIGTKIIAYTQSRSPLVAEHFPSKGFQSSVPHRVHLGIGNQKRIDSLQVIWPDGTAETFFDLASNKLHTLSPSESRGVYQPVSSAKEKQVFVQTKAFAYKHNENNYVDFNRERLVPQMNSNLGPALAVADINNDGIDDVFIGGAKNQTAVLQLSNSDGGYDVVSVPFEKTKRSEVVDAAFFDPDNDGDLDLVLAHGGRAFSKFSPLLDDTFYENIDGQFYHRKGVIPSTRSISTGAVATQDFNLDGYDDVFIGEQFKEMIYGTLGDGFLFQSDGKGAFIEVPQPALKNLGIITDAQWMDYNGDEWPDLVVVGEWMSIRVFLNFKGIFSEVIPKGLEKTRGLWNVLEIADVDGDGKEDLIAGNIGENNFFEEGMKMFVSDFDSNGSAEQIICFKRGEAYVPVLDKDELIAQIPALKKNMVYYEDYGKRSISEILGEASINSALQMEIDSRKTAVFLRKDEGFEAIALPPEAQYSSVYAIQVSDVNEDGAADVLFGGNQYNVKPQFGRHDASSGLLVLGSLNKGMLEFKKKKFLNVKGQIRAIKSLKNINKRMYIFAKNNEEIEFYETID